MANSEQNRLAEAIKDAIYTATGVGLLALNRVQATRREFSEQLPENVRAAWVDLVGQVPEDVRRVLADLSAQLFGSLRRVLSNMVDQAPAIAEVLRKFVLSNDTK